VHKATGKTGSGAKRGRYAPSRPFRVADHLKTDAERAAYLEALLEEGDSRVITLGLRELAESAGGMAVLAKRTGLSRETLYRTLSRRGNPRLDTLAALLHAMGLRLSVSAA
jgi:probable addiction module antidote protein